MAIWRLKNTRSVRSTSVWLKLLKRIKKTYFTSRWISL
jgi:hypothetical protein